MNNGAKRRGPLSGAPRSFSRRDERLVLAVASPVVVLVPVPAIASPVVVPATIFLHLHLGVAIRASARLTVVVAPVPAIQDRNVGHRARDRVVADIGERAVVPARAIPAAVVRVVPVAPVPVDIVVVVANVIDPSSRDDHDVRLVMEHETRTAVRIT